MIADKPLSPASGPQPPDFDFERVIDRRGGDSQKWNKYAGRDVLPLWVADMDFAAPPAVVAALERRVAHRVFGYGKPWAGLVDTTLGYLKRRYDWQVPEEWLVWLPGLVTGLNAACRAVDGAVLTAIPIYPPFLSAPRLAGRKLTTVPLVPSGKTWEWDFARLEAAVNPETRLLLFCHPHNPVGRAWRADELARLAEFCRRHDLIVCSDDIHCDLILDPRPHLPLARLGPDVARRTITLMAPSKTYNIPGLACSFAIIPDEALRNRFTAVMRGIVPDVNVLGLAAADAAFSECDAWRNALIDVLRANRDEVEAAVARMPGLSMTHVEATYLAWIDARGLGVAQPVRFFEEAGVGLSDGADFGTPGWVRLNFGCPRATLTLALQRMASACASAGSADGLR
ncbi:MAG: PatB family C-S lyase [Candidatus Accumulibacter sp.]|jgi:cystathionine beta-lyase|nr:PatB family C-S lyase [Accumulibacter sp.]